ncbi:MAG: J domain-containing protein [Deltaproteobacteria bacterium]|nr:J domain-containing protein [Deltaproteobacteria bacterium]
MVTDNRTCRIYSRAALACLLCLAGAASAASAESVKVSGLSFPVEALHEVDSSNVKITLFGETEIIARSSLDDFVVHKYFQNTSAAAALPRSGVRSFIQESVAQGKFDRAVDALRDLCRQAGEPDSKVAEFLVSLPDTSNSGAFFRVASAVLAENNCAGAAAAEVIVRAGVGDTEWAKTKGIRFAFDHEKKVRALLEAKIRQAAKARNFSEIGRDVEFYGAVFGTEDPRYLQLVVLEARVAQATEAVQKGDLEALYPLVEQSKSNEELSELLSPLFVETLHTQAAKALTRGDSGNAIHILSHLDIRKRTPTTHELAQRSLQALQPSERPVMAEGGTAAFLRALSESDERVRAAYISYLERSFEYFIEKGSFDDVNYYFEHLTALRPDPNSANDRLRVQQISAYLDRKMMVSARDKLRQVQTGVPLFARARFTLAGLYFDPMYLVISVVSLLAGAIVILLAELIGKLRRRLMHRISARKAAAASEQEEEVIQPAFVQSGLVRSMSPSMIEYRECLEVFGLTSEASLKAIKAAYRHAVKEVHPDLNKDLDQEASERFLLLTKTYERILELYDQAQPPKLNSHIE